MILPLRHSSYSFSTVEYTVLLAITPGLPRRRASLGPSQRLGTSPRRSTANPVIKSALECLQLRLRLAHMQCPLHPLWLYQSLGRGGIYYYTRGYITKRQFRVLPRPTARCPAPPARVPGPEVRKKIQACVPRCAAPGARGARSRIPAAAALRAPPALEAYPPEKTRRKRVPLRNCISERPSDTRLTAVLTATAARSLTSQRAAKLGTQSWKGHVGRRLRRASWQRVARPIQRLYLRDAPEASRAQNTEHRAQNTEHGDA